ncbi:polyprenol phosphomannose-dependent alpha 1,6 mannosyltransferase MptB [Actinocorallia populi]|uniref:polyprenol phosphomannose-dependent alpha 1,6 mannosyltransferase MptB n=1 Tax=Actinocorallia populi TaxID=2079200 RepID=UPI0013005AE6|nr:polyprenol phosphomannose-dependent alpha 1,6 mannosyltransferase MptB [Actinocorallia populi]
MASEQAPPALDGSPARPRTGGGTALTPPGGTPGLVCLGLSLAAFLALSLLGPSLVQPALGGSGPPWTFHVDPAPGPVLALLVAGILLAGLGLALCFRAAARGWSPRPGLLLAAGAVLAAVFSLSPPVGSSDHLNYAAYGHMIVSGLDPYVTTATDLGDDPYGDAVQEWRDTPSIYGPLVTGVQALAALAGGDSPRLTVLVLSLVNGLAFVLTGLILHLRTRDERARLRAALLWTLNPLLLYHLVAGSHNDVLGITAAVAALALFTAGTGGAWRAFGTGAAVGMAVATKFPAGVVGGGPAWRLLTRRRFGELAALLAGAGLVVAVGYGLVGPHALDRVREAADSISLANPWRLLAGRDGGVLGLDLPRSFVSAGSLVLLVVLVWLLVRALPEADPVLAVSAALVLAWLFAASYALPWYDGLGWAVLAFLPWSRFDWCMLARTVALSLAYLPARDPRLAGLPDGLHWLVTGVRATVMPFVLATVLVLLVWCCLRRPRPAPAL